MPRRVIDAPPLAPDDPAKTGSDAGLRPLHIPPVEALTSKEALHQFRGYGLTPDILKRLIRHYSIANQALPGGPLRISAPGLAMALDGDRFAIDRLRQDDRSHPDVVRYFNRLGIPAE